MPQGSTDWPTPACAPFDTTRVGRRFDFTHASLPPANLPSCVLVVGPIAMLAAVTPRQDLADLVGEEFAGQQRRRKRGVGSDGSEPPPQAPS